MEVADQIVVMNHGRVEQTAGARELYDEPANEFVMSFVGPVNQLDDDWIGEGLGVVKHPGVEVREMKASSYLATAPRGYFDMVLADPPYAFEDVDELVAAIEPVLEDAAIVVIERHVDSPATQWPEGFEPTGQKLKKRTFGIARFDMAIYHRPSAEED